MLLSIRNWKKAKERETKWRTYVVTDWNMFSAPRNGKCEQSLGSGMTIHPCETEDWFILSFTHVSWHHIMSHHQHAAYSSYILASARTNFRIWSCEFHPDVYRWGEYWCSDCHKYIVQPYLVLSGEQKKKDTFIVLIWKLMEHSSFCIWQYLSVDIKLWRILWGKR